MIDCQAVHWCFTLNTDVGILTYSQWQCSHNIQCIENIACQSSLMGIALVLLIFGYKPLDNWIFYMMMCNETSCNSLLGLGECLVLSIAVKAVDVNKYGQHVSTSSHCTKRSQNTSLRVCTLVSSNIPRTCLPNHKQGLAVSRCVWTCFTFKKKKKKTNQKPKESGYITWEKQSIQ